MKYLTITCLLFLAVNGFAADRHSVESLVPKVPVKVKQKIKAREYYHEDEKIQKYYRKWGDTISKLAGKTVTIKTNINQSRFHDKGDGKDIQFTAAHYEEISGLKTIVMIQGFIPVNSPELDNLRKAIKDSNSELGAEVLLTGKLATISCGDESLSNLPDGTLIKCDIRFQTVDVKVLTSKANSGRPARR